MMDDNSANNIILSSGISLKEAFENEARAYKSNDQVIERLCYHSGKEIVLYQQRTVGASHRWFKGCKRPYPQGGGFKAVYTSRKIVFNAFGQ